MELKRADGLLLEVMAGFKALLVFLGRRQVDDDDADVYYYICLRLKLGGRLRPRRMC